MPPEVPGPLEPPDPPHVPLAAHSDQQLLAAHVAGDPDAFGELVRRHRDRLWAVALRTLGHPDDAADALQEALLAAFRSAASYRGEAQVTTWLHRVVVNACLDRVRRNQVRATVPLPDDDRQLPDPVDPIARHELAVVLSAALATLPHEQRAAIVLVDVEGYPVEEAARILGCAPGTVKSRCARGRLRLRPLVSSLREGTGPDADEPAHHPPAASGTPAPAASGTPAPDAASHPRGATGGEQA